MGIGPDEPDRALSRFIHCAYCGRPVTVTYQQHVHPADHTKASTWACPYSGCGLNNAVKGVRVLAANVRETPAKRGLSDAS